MPADSRLVDLIKWLWKHFDKEILVVAGDSVRGIWRRMFASRNILILGPRRAGKSSLAVFLKSGKPYEIIDGEIRTPEPTSGAVIVDHKFSLQKGDWLRLKTDVSGDPDFRALWKQALTDVRPHGIIYMLDGRAAQRDPGAAVEEIFQYVLSEYRLGMRELRACYVFVNYSDQWASSPAEERKVVRAVSSEFEERLTTLPPLQHLRYGVFATQLAPHAGRWDHVERALKHFGTDLAV